MSWSFLSEWQSTLPPSGHLARRCWLEIKYIPADTKEAVDISEDISRYFLSMDYSEAMSGEADDLTITLEDRIQIWLESWLPEDEGNMLDVTVHILNRISLSDGETVVHLGKFELDELTIEGMPSTVKLKGVSLTYSPQLKLGDSAINDTCLKNEVLLYLLHGSMSQPKFFSLSVLR